MDDRFKSLVLLNKNRFKQFLVLLNKNGFKQFLLYYFNALRYKTLSIINNAKSLIWIKALLLPPDFYFTIIVACIVSFVPVAFQETISDISSLLQLKAWLKITLFLLFTMVVIFMGRRFIGFARFAKEVFEQVKRQNVKTTKAKEDRLNKILLQSESENRNAKEDIVAAIKWFSLASLLLLIMVVVQ